jgi:uncharacterized glyoxalase superfamily protein PhnB
MQTTSIIPVFNVTNIDTSVKFYTEVLGFTQAFRYGTYVGLRMGKCELHICPSDPGNDSRIGRGNAYLICDEVDEFFRKIKAAGAKPKNEPADQFYGMRDFIVHDPDGNQLSFGCDNEKD